MACSKPRPERPILSAQCEALGRIVTNQLSLKKTFIERRRGNMNDPFRVKELHHQQPGLRPGLTESAFQAVIVWKPLTVYDSTELAEVRQWHPGDSQPFISRSSIKRSGPYFCFMKCPQFIWMNSHVINLLTEGVCQI